MRKQTTYRKNNRKKRKGVHSKNASKGQNGYKKVQRSRQVKVNTITNLTET